MKCGCNSEMVVVPGVGVKRHVLNSVLANVQNKANSLILVINLN